MTRRLTEAEAVARALAGRPVYADETPPSMAGLGVPTLFRDLAATGWGLTAGVGDCHPCYPQATVDDHSWDDDGVCVDCGAEWDAVPGVPVCYGCESHSWLPRCVDCGNEWDEVSS